MIENYSSGRMICASYDPVNSTFRVHFETINCLSLNLPLMYFKRLVRKVPNIYSIGGSKFFSGLIVQATCANLSDIYSIGGSKYYPVWLCKRHALTYLIFIAFVVVNIIRSDCASDMR